MTEATRRAIRIEQGTDDGFSFILKDNGGSPIDLIAENAQFRMRVKTDYSLSAITILTFSSTGVPNSNIVIQPGGITGKVQVNISPSDTIALTLTDESTAYFYDIEVTLDATSTQRLFKGDFTLFKELATPDSDFV